MPNNMCATITWNLDWYPNRYSHLTWKLRPFTTLILQTLVMLIILVLWNRYIKLLLLIYLKSNCMISYCFRQNKRSCVGKPQKTIEITNQKPSIMWQPWVFNFLILEIFGYFLGCHDFYSLIPFLNNHKYLWKNTKLQHSQIEQVKFLISFCML